MSLLVQESAMMMMMEDEHHDDDDLPLGVGRVPRWWMEITPHYVLDLDEYEAQRKEDELLALYYAQMAAADDAGLLTPDGQFYEHENDHEHNHQQGWNNGSKWSGRGAAPRQTGNGASGQGHRSGRNFTIDPRILERLGVDKSDPDYPHYLSGAKVPPNFLQKLQELCGNERILNNMRQTDYGRYGRQAEKPNFAPSWAKKKLRSTKTGQNIRKGEYNDSPNKYSRRSVPSAEAIRESLHQRQQQKQQAQQLQQQHQPQQLQLQASPTQVSDFPCVEQQQQEAASLEKADQSSPLPPSSQVSQSIPRPTVWEEPHPPVDDKKVAPVVDSVPQTQPNPKSSILKGSRSVNSEGSNSNNSKDVPTEMDSHSSMDLIPAPAVTATPKSSREFVQAVNDDRDSSKDVPVAMESQPSSDPIPAEATPAAIITTPAEATPVAIITTPKSVRTVVKRSKSLGRGRSRSKHAPADMEHPSSPDPILASSVATTPKTFRAVFKRSKSVDRRSKDVPKEMEADPILASPAASTPKSFRAILKRSKSITRSTKDLPVVAMESHQSSSSSAADVIPAEEAAATTPKSFRGIFKRSKSITRSGSSKSITGKDASMMDTESPCSSADANPAAEAAPAAAATTTTPKSFRAILKRSKSIGGGNSSNKDEPKVLSPSKSSDLSLLAAAAATATPKSFRSVFRRSKSITRGSSKDIPKIATEESITTPPPSRPHSPKSIEDGNGERAAAAPVDGPEQVVVPKAMEPKSSSFSVPAPVVATQSPRSLRNKGETTAESALVDECHDDAPAKMMQSSYSGSYSNLWTSEPEKPIPIKPLPQPTPAVVNKDSNNVEEVASNKHMPVMMHFPTEPEQPLTNLPKKVKEEATPKESPIDMHVDPPQPKHKEGGCCPQEAGEVPELEAEDVPEIYAGEVIEVVDGETHQDVSEYDEVEVHDSDDELVEEEVEEEEEEDDPEVARLKALLAAKAAELARLQAEYAC